MLVVFNYSKQIVVPAPANGIAIHALHMVELLWFPNTLRVSFIAILCISMIEATRSKLITILYFTALLLPLLSEAQPKFASVSGYNDFKKFVVTKFKTTDEIRRNCDWQYAVVKVQTDAENRIIRVETLSSGPNSIKANFNYLIGYQFNKKLSIKKRPVVFYYTTENENLGKDCDVDPQNHSPASVTMQVLNWFNLQYQKEPNTIFLYEPVFSMIYAPIIN